MRRIFTLIGLAVALSGCGGAVIGSIPQPPAPNDDKEVAMTSAPVWTHTDKATGDERTLPTYGLPVAYFPITIKRDDKCNLTVSLDKPIYARDPSSDANFALEFHHYTYTNDSLTVQTDDAGLLMGINTTSENQSLAAVDQVFAIAAQAAGLHGPFIAFQAPSKAEEKPPCADKTVALTYVFDPFKPESLKGLNDALTSANAQVCVLAPAAVGTPPAFPISCTRSEVSHKPTFSAEARQCKSGDNTRSGKTISHCVYFRALGTFALTVVDQSTSAPRGVQQLVFTAPDESLTYAFPLDRDDFVKFDVQLGFDHGVLNKVQSNNPSQLLAILQIPSDLIKDVLGLQPKK